MATRKKSNSLHKRVLDVRPDSLDFRDRLYVPSLVEVPRQRALSAYQALKVPVLDQGSSNGCTGFALATVVHALLRARRLDADKDPVSPWMLYAMARRYDEWAGETDEGSSLRGAMKGWHKHGVCHTDLWREPDAPREPSLSRARALDALQRPLGAYFRVNHKDLAALHAALAETGVLYASAAVHAGWDAPDDEGRIERRVETRSGHAFAIVAYDTDGFWLQNAWGRHWGQGGFAHLSYEDWLDNGTDVWVARLGAPVRLPFVETTGASPAPGLRTGERMASPDLRPHVVTLGNDGRLDPSGPYGNTAADVVSIFNNDFPRITADWPQKRILLYAHGGLVNEKTALQRTQEYVQLLLREQIYPLAFVWKSDLWTTLGHLLRDALNRRRSEGALDAAKDFMLDRLDDALEPLARHLGGRRLWNEMKENALFATTQVHGGARLVTGHVAHLMQSDPTVEIHVAGHSAGSIFLAPIVGLLTSNGRFKSPLPLGAPGFGLDLTSCTLWAPACTIELFKATYAPAVQAGCIQRFSVFALHDDIERADHCAQLYHQSLLYLVSQALEARRRQPLLGLARYAHADTELQRLIADEKIEWVLAPNAYPPGDARASGARAHGDFDDDEATVRALVARILGQPSSTSAVQFQRSAQGLRDSRRRLLQAAVQTHP